MIGNVFSVPKGIYSSLPSHKIIIRIIINLDAEPMIHVGNITFTQRTDNILVVSVSYVNFMREAARGIVDADFASAMTF